MISTLNKKTYQLILTLLLIITFALPIKINAKSIDKNDKNLVNIYFFHSNECSHCNSEIKFLNSIENRYNNIKIYRLEVNENNNNELRINIQKLYNLKNSGVPLTIIGNTPYIGYSEEISNITFTKTIEYYSRYGYHDEVGKYLKIKNLPTYKIDETNPTLEEFLETYGNYKLIGNLYTNDLDTTANAIILGLLSQLNIIKLISIIILIILLHLKRIKKASYHLSTYLILSLLINTTNIISNDIYTIIINLIILALFIIEIINYLKKQETKYLYKNLIIIITLITSYLENYYYEGYSKAFKEIIKLHNLTGLNKINYYSNYFFIILIINILLILVYQHITNKYNQEEIS